MIALLAAVSEESKWLRSELGMTPDSLTSPWRSFSGKIGNQHLLLVHCGVGKAAAAAATTMVLERQRPEAVVLFGCGGALPGSGLGLGDLALADAEIFADEGVQQDADFLSLEQLDLPIAKTPHGPVFNYIPIAADLPAFALPLVRNTVETAGRAMTNGPFITVSSCSGTLARGEELAARHHGICENMEGAAVALVCALYQVPLLELRGISNLVEDRDPSRWDLTAGIEMAQKAVLSLLAGWARS